MKVGDKLMCKVNTYVSLTVNKIYDIIRTEDDFFYIINDTGNETFYTIAGDFFYWEDYFYNKVEMRKIKMVTIK